MYKHSHDLHHFCCVVFQWAAGVIPVLPHSGQDRHAEADTQYWLPEQCTTVCGAHDLSLWQVRNEAPCTIARPGDKTEVSGHFNALANSCPWKKKNPNICTPAV